MSQPRRYWLHEIKAREGADINAKYMLASDYDALARDLAACKIARDGFTAASDTAHARIRELEQQVSDLNQQIAGANARADMADSRVMQLDARIRDIEAALQTSTQELEDVREWTLLERSMLRPIEIESINSIVASNRALLASDRSEKPPR